MNETTINVGKRLRIARGGMGQREAGARMGLSAQTISNHERGLVSLTNARLRQYAAVYDTPFAFLFDARPPITLTLVSVCKRGEPRVRDVMEVER